MTRKILLAILVALLALTACTPAAVETPVLPTETPLPEPTAVPTEIPPTEAPPTETPLPEPTDEPEPELLTFTDDRDVVIELVEPAQRIVALGASSVESLFAIGAGSQVVGREEFTMYPPEALDVPSVGSLWGELPTEAIVALEPDLVIAPQIISPEQVAALEELGLTVFYQRNPLDFFGLYAQLRVLAEMTGHEAEAEILVDEIHSRVEAVLTTLEGVEDRPIVFYELDATDAENPYTVGGGSYIDTLIHLAGGTNAAFILSGDYSPMSTEQIIIANPEIILLGDAPYGVTPESVAERPGWDVIDAVKNGNVIPFDPFLVSVPGPRLVDGLEAMAKIFHPDLFE